MPNPDEGARRLGAFLALIRSIEVPGKDDWSAYRTIYGGHSFIDMASHPNRSYAKWHRKSDAAGAYQVTYPTYLDAVKKGVVANFSEASQDKIALWLISRRGATQHIQSGEYSPALLLLNSTWSSSPGGSSQEITRENAIAFIKRLAPDP